MQAFNYIQALMTNSKPQNGHALANMQNRKTLAAAKEEIEKLLKG